MTIFRALCLTLLLTLPVTAHGFNETGHKTIAALSYDLLNDKGQAYLEQLFGEFARQEWISSANWPATLSSVPGQEWRESLHFVWFALDDQEFIPDKHCPFNSCSVGAALESLHVLNNPAFAEQEKRQAVKFLQHYIADMHQPTNCGYQRDQSGRDIQLKTTDLTYVDLHWVWEEGLIELNGSNWSLLSGKLMRDHKNSSDQDTVWLATTEIKDWIWGCHQVAKKTAYRLAATRTWGQAYYRQAWPVYEQQIMKAAVRIAYLVNQTAEQQM